MLDASRHRNREAIEPSEARSPFTAARSSVSSPPMLIARRLRPEHDRNPPRPVARATFVETFDLGHLELAGASCDRTRTAKVWSVVTGVFR